MTRRGKYVVFEGPDGCGKSTLAKMLVAALKNAGETVRSLAFPGRESSAGNLIRDVFEGKAALHPEAMMWLFVAEGKDMEPQIRRHVSEGDWVVCDRHTMVSGLIYQGEVHGQTLVDQVTEPAHFIMPDRVYFVDVPARVAMERRAARGEARNALYEPEKLDRLEAMCKAYRDLRGRFTSETLDGTQPLATNLERVWYDLGLKGSPQP